MILLRFLSESSALVQSAIGDPYEGCGGLSCLWVFLSRLSHIITLPDDLYIDELQIVTMAFIGISAALVGGLLVLRRSAMVANSLAHTVLCGIVAAYLWERWFGKNAQGAEVLLSFQALWIAAGTSALFTTWSSDWVHKQLRLSQETSIALVFSTLFALGILLVSMLAPHAHIGLEVIMGNVDALLPKDAKLAAGVALCNAVLCALFSKEHVAAAFDEQFSKSIGIKTRFLDYLLVMQTSLTMMSALRTVGSFLVLAWISGLPILALARAKSLVQLWWMASCLALLLSITSVCTTRQLLSYHQMPLSTSGMSVALLALLQIATGLIGSLYYRFFKKRSLEHN